MGADALVEVGEVDQYQALTQPSVSTAIVRQMLSPMSNRFASQ
jgi:hypothetical protein